MQGSREVERIRKRKFNEEWSDEENLDEDRKRRRKQNKPQRPEEEEDEDED